MSTTLSDYMARAATTALRSDLPYLALGLCEEAGEYADALNAQELGDVLWYWLMLCKELGMDPDALADRASRGNAKNSIDTCAALLIAASKVAQRVKKHMRDGTAIEAAPMIKTYRALARCVTWHVTTIDAVAERLFTKLADRAQRGVLKGDGDAR